jgi:hypothetical protein
MSNSRASIFENDDDLDISAFKPKASPDPAAPPPEQVRAVSEAANFRSREPVRTLLANPASASATTEASGRRRQPRTHRTGRNVQFNVKASQETIDAFYRISDAQNWVLGETLERALAALERELTGRS